MYFEAIALGCGRARRQGDTPDRWVAQETAHMLTDSRVFALHPFFRQESIR